MISTRVSAEPSLASTHARTGLLLGSTHAVHAASINGFSLISATHTLAERIFDLSLPHSFKKPSIFLRISSVCALALPALLSAVVPAINTRLPYSTARHSTGPGWWRLMLLMLESPLIYR